MGPEGKQGGRRGALSASYGRELLGDEATLITLENNTQSTGHTVLPGTRTDAL